MNESSAGPGKALSSLEQREYLFELAERKPFFIKVPVALMDGIIGFLDFLTKIFPSLEVWSMPLHDAKCVLKAGECNSAG